MTVFTLKRSMLHASRWRAGRRVDKAAVADPVFRKTQEDERDRMYFDPAVTLAGQDGLRALGQFAYYDAAVMHGMSGLRDIRAAALRKAKTPKAGSDETAFLEASTHP